MRCISLNVNNTNRTNPQKSTGTENYLITDLVAQNLRKKIPHVSYTWGEFSIHGFCSDLRTVQTHKFVCTAVLATDMFTMQFHRHSELDFSQKCEKARSDSYKEKTP